MGIACIGNGLFVPTSEKKKSYRPCWRCGALTKYRMERRPMCVRCQDADGLVRDKDQR